MTDTSGRGPWPRIAVLGAGVSGLAMGHYLTRAGLHNFTLYEKADRVGGYWRENTYPGCACDVPAPMYSFSFALNPNWSHSHAPAPEIRAYIEEVARSTGLARRVELRSEVASASFENGAWRVQLVDGKAIEADVLVNALGPLHQINIPDIEGLEAFQGPVVHTARWPNDLDLRDRRVAIIGTAASAVQIVPEIAPQVRHLTILQRTPNWIVPRPDVHYGPRARRLLSSVPGLARLQRWIYFLLLEARFFMTRRGTRTNRRVERNARRHLERIITDPQLQARLTPSYPAGCKRLLFHNRYYPALLRDNVRLETEAIARIDEEGPILADGGRIDVDLIILATGFHALALSIDIRGDRGVSLSEQWAKNGSETLRSVMTPNFPNYFFMLGPASGLGHHSMLFIAEQQANYITKVIRAMGEQGATWIAPKLEAASQFTAKLQGAMQSTVWTADCNSWYRHSGGKIYSMWPYTATELWWSMRRLRHEEYEWR